MRAVFSPAQLSSQSITLLCTKNTEDVVGREKITSLVQRADLAHSGGIDALQTTFIISEESNLSGEKR